jgi:hypothetical protein
VPKGVTPLATSANGTYRCADDYSVVANWYYYFAIGNCPAGAEIEVVSYASENTQTHEHSYGGFVNGAFSGCGWINTAYPVEKLNSNSHSACAGSGSSREFKVEESTFMEKYNHDVVGEGSPVNNPKPCPEYANYRPWSDNNVEKELIRTAPAYAASGLGSSYPAIKWRYVTKYASTDGTGKYVMAEDDRIKGAGEGNWVFVPLSCLRNSPSELPENTNERLPPPPTVTTEGASGVATPSATLNGTINPNGVETKYYFEYGTTTSYGSYTATSNAGAGTTGVAVHAAVTGLAPGTTYYFRIVASSAIGESFGGPVSFTTQPPPTVTTSAASEVHQEHATLNGTVNPQGLDTHYYFQYGPTTAYGSSTPSTDAGSDTSTLDESATVTGMQPSTTYHYRMVATSAGDTVYGSDQSFTTPRAARPAVAVSPTLGLVTDWRGSDGNLYETLYEKGKWVTFSPTWEQLTSVKVAGDPALTYESTNGLVADWRGTDGNLYETLYSGGKWTTFSPTAGQLASGLTMAGDPGLAVESTNGLVADWRGSNGDLYETLYSASQWTTFSPTLGESVLMAGN